MLRRLKVALCAQTPEWKNAYIDYRGLKKRITAIRRAHQAVSSSSSDEDLIIPPASPRDQPVSFSAPRPSEYASSSTSGPSVRRQSESADTPGHEHDREHHAHWQIRNDREEVESSPERLEGDGNPDSPTRPSLAARSTTVEAAALPRMRRGRSNTVTTVLGRALQRASSTKGTTSGPVAGPRFDVRHPIPLKDLIPQLTPVERAFFEKLDEELDKVESFYCERERDMRHRANLLKEQLQELKDHRRAFYDAEPSNATHHLPPPTTRSIQYWKQTLSRRNSSETARPASLNDAKGAVELATPKPRVESGSGDDSSKVTGLELDRSKATGSQRWGETSISKSVQALFPFRSMAPPEKRGSDTDATVIEDVRDEDAGSEV
ncbi:hypothetical protein OH76DRAFT_101013 [Lentinus brumalis]|uniref:SPX domain-containing protein n=1 Tax=Lentinus brumalis TaxID=2498619 RepID=A0A371CQ74_9APHY|nr:hypothetical protein OH76DRAFT_101013 [Polyporus brumalis]